MELQKQVTNLEISKRLKELGVKQESLFVRTLDTGQVTGHPSDFLKDGDKWNWVSAFTVAELGEMLMKIKFAEFSTYPTKDNQIRVYPGTVLRMFGELKDYDGETADTEADARGKILVYLIENKFIKP